MAFYHVPGQKWIDRYLAIESQARIGLVTKGTKMNSLSSVSLCPGEFVASNPLPHASAWITSLLG